MFVRVIQAKAGDAAGLRRQLEEWGGTIAPKARGWLGATAGVAAQGDFLIVSRFESEDAARRAFDLPERAEWWAATEKMLAGPAEVHDTTDVRVWTEGSDGAGFVQMMQAKVADRAGLVALEESMMGAFAEQRPDAIGHMHVWLPDGRLHVVDWFTSEAEARAGEKKEYPEEMRRKFGEWMALLSDIRWHDIPDPWLASP